MNPNPSFAHTLPGLRAVSLGLILSVLTILFGQGLGILFGANEDAVKGRLKSSAAAVLDSAYQGDEAAMKQVLDKSWRYMLRAHLHAGGMGTTAFAFILFLGLARRPGWLSWGTSLALGAGGLGYSVYWMLAGFRAPGLGNTSAARDSLDWLALPSSGMFLIASLITFALVVAFACSPRGGRNPES
jgi:hypothetical protein